MQSAIRCVLYPNLDSGLLRYNSCKPSGGFEQIPDENAPKTIRTWQWLAEQVQQEKDPSKIVQLADELCQALDEDGKKAQSSATQRVRNLPTPDGGGHRA